MRYGYLVFGLVLGLAFESVLLAQTDSSATRLSQEIRTLVSRARFQRSNVAVAVINDEGRQVVDINARAPFKPASNQKILTTAAALHWLGTDHVYETTIWATAPLVDGVVAGDLVVRGRGDPNISGRFYDGDPVHLLRLWARRLYDAGLRRVEGDIVADDTYFDDVRFIPSWVRAQEGSWYSAQVSALSLNDNCIDVSVRPGVRTRSRAIVETSPRAPVVQISGAPKTSSQGDTSIILRRKSGTNLISISGSIRKQRRIWKGHVTFDDPALVFSSAYEALLRETGIEVQGVARKKARTRAVAHDVAVPRPISGQLTAGETETAEGVLSESKGAELEEAIDSASDTVLLVRHTSGLLDDLAVIHKKSQNLHAEMLLKVMGAEVYSEGSLPSGSKAIRRFLELKSLPVEGLEIADGSGLSHHNRASALLFARLLDTLKKADYFPTYRDSLAVGGRDGTLKKRFRQRKNLIGNVFAKTGFIRGVSALSGYVVRGDKTWCFSVLVNGFPPKARSAKVLQEGICERIYDAMASD